MSYYPPKQIGVLFFFHRNWSERFHALALLFFFDAGKDNFNWKCKWN